MGWLFKNMNLSRLKRCKLVISELLKNRKLIFSSYSYKRKAGNKIPGLNFDKFGRKIGWKLFLKGDINRGLDLIVDPVRTVRYFEFDFCEKAYNWEKCEKALDISSPRMFMFYLTNKYPSLKYNYINPDIKDIRESEKIYELLKPKNLSIEVMNAKKSKFRDNYFDAIVSISVIEHIDKEEDITALKEMWRILKKGGSLIITIPLVKKAFDQYLDFDEYGLNSPNNKGKYFATRWYNKELIEKRIINVLGKNPEKIAIFGEKESGFFWDYSKKERIQGLNERKKDAFYTAKMYQYYKDYKDNKGLSIIGMVFKK